MNSFSVEVFIVVYLKFKLNWLAWTWPGNPTLIDNYSEGCVSFIHIPFLKVQQGEVCKASGTQWGLAPGCWAQGLWSCTGDPGQVGFSLRTQFPLLEDEALLCSSFRTLKPQCPGVACPPHCLYTQRKRLFLPGKTHQLSLPIGCLQRPGPLWWPSGPMCGKAEMSSVEGSRSWASNPCSATTKKGRKGSMNKEIWETQIYIHPILPWQFKRTCSYKNICRIKPV